MDDKKVAKGPSIIAVVDREVDCDISSCAEGSFADFDCDDRGAKGVPPNRDVCHGYVDQTASLDTHRNHDRTQHPELEACRSH